MSLSRVERIRAKLEAALTPMVLEIRDDSALRTAVRRRQIEIVRLLLDAGADINRVYVAEAHRITMRFLWDSGTALTAAVDTGQPDMVKLLLERGADPGLAHPLAGKSALERASSYLQAARKYDGPEKIEAAKHILRLLEERLAAAE